jgi:hypothetical protein
MLRVSEDMSHFDNIGVDGDNIKMDHQEGMDLIILPHDRKMWRSVAKTVMDIRVPFYAVEFLQPLSVKF